MVTKVKKATPLPATPQAPPMVDSKGNQRIYVDLPRALVQRYNILAAMRGVNKRTLITSLLTDAINRAAAEAKL